MTRIKALARRLYASETARYLAAGAAATFVDLAVFFLLRHVAGTAENPANIISIAAAALFAYFTNKLFVFRKRVSGIPALILEFCAFIASRAATMLVEYFGYAPARRLFGGSSRLREYAAKTVVIAAVVALNYGFGKLVVFRKAKGGGG
ncbi:MAG: GtrA family protein [Oscillospiraceae bacterium]|jgi:putative flippase GtrA|nr:GtrA family protein [Oscillospiraceae bacterium]